MNQLTEQEKEEALRFFNLRRRVSDASNIKDNFSYRDYDFSWICNKVDFSGLSEQDVFALVVIAHHLEDYGVNSSAFDEVFGWSKHKVYKIAKNEKFIFSTTLFRESDGLIAGKGYVLDGAVAAEMREMYEKFLWHDISVPLPSGVGFFFEVNIPGVYTGVLKGSRHDDDSKVRVYKPIYSRYNMSNWPKDGLQHKRELEIDKSHVKKWKVNRFFF